MSASTAIRRTTSKPAPPTSARAGTPRPKKPKGGFWPTLILLIGAAWALWESGILREIPAVWIGIAAIIAIGLGIMLAVASSRPAVSTRS